MDGAEEQPEEFVDLHRFVLGTTDDNRVLMRFYDEHGDWTSVRLPFDFLPQMTAPLVELTTKHFVQKALDQAPQPPAPELPATETALLVAKSLEVIRWEFGGVVLRATTLLGVPIQIALSPDLAESLRRKLEARPPQSRT